MEGTAKNASEELLDYLKANFNMANGRVGQFRDKHIWIDLIGDIIVWNALNMRYRHKVFRQEVGKGCHAECLAWLKNEYTGEAQEVPAQYVVRK